MSRRRHYAILHLITGELMCSQQLLGNKPQIAWFCTKADARKDLDSYLKGKYNYWSLCLVEDIADDETIFYNNAMQRGKLHVREEFEIVARFKYD